MAGALTGIRVLELGPEVTGAYCGRLLGEFGAEVVKVEPPGGDALRDTGPFPGDQLHPECSGLFLYLHRNKLGVTLNPESATGRRLLRRLVERSDIVLSSLTAAEAQTLDLSYAALAPVKPQIVVTLITPFGTSGPYRDYVATEMTAFAMTGRMQAHGPPERAPLQFAPDVAACQVGASAAAGTVAAYFQAAATGEGQEVDVPFMEAHLGNVDARTLHYIYTGQKGQRHGGVRRGYPNGIYPCADGYLLFAAGGEPFFSRLCRAMGHEEMLTDPRWATAEARRQHEAEYEMVFLPWLLERTKEQVFSECEAFGVMCAPVNDPSEVFDAPQNLARDAFLEMPVGAATVRVPGAPVKMPVTPWEVRRTAPTLGADNVAIYCNELGLSRRELARLRTASVI